MKMSKLFVSAVLLVALAAAAAADDYGVGNDTKAFTSTWGAKVRLLQLEASIDRNILAGNEIVSAIKEGNSSADTGELEGIIAELDALKTEVSEAAGDPGTGDDAAKKFVDMKNDAVELSREFRENARELLKGGDIEGLRKRVREITRSERKELQEEIKRTRCGYNAEKAGELFQAAGISDAGLVEKIQDCEAKVKDVKDAIKNATSNMNATERRQALQALREKVAKGNVFMNSVADKVRYNHLERVQTRLERRLEKAETLNLTEGAKLRLDNRTSWVADRMGKIEEAFAGRIARVGNVTAKKVERIEGLEEKLENRTDRREGHMEERLERVNLTDAQKNRTANKLEKIENHSEKILDKLEGRKDKAEENGQKLQEKLGNMLGNNAGGASG
jgi:DNA repair exonuclease SbcCD ATPase subunit